MWAHFQEYHLAVEGRLVGYPYCPKFQSLVGFDQIHQVKSFCARMGEIRAWQCDMSIKDMHDDDSPIASRVLRMYNEGHTYGEIEKSILNTVKENPTYFDVSESVAIQIISTWFVSHVPWFLTRAEVLYKFTGFPSLTEDWNGPQFVEDVARRVMIEWANEQREETGVRPKCSDSDSHQWEESINNHLRSRGFRMIRRRAQPHPLHGHFSCAYSAR